MLVKDDAVSVRVPATSANLGPGYDSLGLALSLYDDVKVRATTGPTHVTVNGQGEGEVPTGEDNLIVQTMRVGLECVGAPQVGINMECSNRIPHGRGLGSSASAIIAGLMLVRALIVDEAGFTDQQILTTATEIEGHPDNVAPALMGGFTVAWMGESGVCALRKNVTGAVHPMIFIPSFKLSTAVARASIPDTISHTDAAFNVSRAALLASVLTSDCDRFITGHNADDNTVRTLLMDATADRLHQEYRRGAMESSLALVDWLRREGFPAVVSGAGPTVLSLISVPEEICQQAVQAGWAVHDTPVEQGGAFLTSGKLARIQGTNIGG